MKSPNQPIEINAEAVKEVLSWTHASADLVIGTQLGSARKGEVWPDNTGERRLILFLDRGGKIPGSNEGGIAYFLRKDKAYMQSFAGFRGDVGVGNIQKRTAAGMAAVEKFLEAEMAFLEAFLSAISLPLLLAISGKNLVAFLVKHRKSFPKWKAAAEGLLLANRVLYNHAPTLYRVLVTTAIYDFARNMPDHLSVEVSAKSAAKTFGKFLGGLPKLMAGVAVTGIQLLLAALKGVGGAVASGAAIATAKATGKGYGRPRQVLVALLTLGASITPEVSEKIVAEYDRNPVTIAKAIEYLEEAVKILASLQVALRE